MIKATLIARTEFNDEIAAEITGGWETDANGGEALAEFAGRACYQSWEKPNPETASNAAYLANIIKRHHLSVLEHAVATFYLTGVSRAFTHELIRHRHFSYGELSQRYVDVMEAPFISPPAILNDDTDAFGIMAEAGILAKIAYKKLTERLMLQGNSRKQAREAARAVLPNMTETRIVVTGNMRAWREFLAKRPTLEADAEMCRSAVELGKQLKHYFPNFFADMFIEPGDRETIIFV